MPPGNSSPQSGGPRATEPGVDRVVTVGKLLPRQTEKLGRGQPEIGQLRAFRHVDVTASSDTACSLRQPQSASYRIAALNHHRDQSRRGRACSQGACRRCLQVIDTFQQFNVRNGRQSVAKRHGLLKTNRADYFESTCHGISFRCFEDFYVPVRQPSAR